MGVIALKFGGSSLADAEHFKKVKSIIEADERRKFIVVSAPGKRNSQDEKVTDLLLECYDKAHNKQNFDEPFEKVHQRYKDIIKDLGLDFSLDSDFDYIKLSILKHIGKDYIVSRGEYLNGRIMAEYLNVPFVDAADGIFFNEDGSFNSEKTNKAMHALLCGTDMAVVPGFYGSKENGTIKTFSRGGSDITGAIVARAVKADVYENWTDVSGMLMADPTAVDNPKPIEEITYRELRELSYMGAKVLHEDAVFPVRIEGIPINIKNTNRPDDKGTMIVKKAQTETTETVITGIAGKQGFSSVYIEKDMMNAEVGFGRRVLQVFENHKIGFEHLPSGIDTMTVVVNSNDIKDIKPTLEAEIYKVTDADKIVFHEDLALIAVVGRGMVSTEGTAGRVFSALAKQHINIRMIDQGSSELNIIIGIDNICYKKALQTIYNEFVG